MLNRLRDAFECLNSREVKYLVIEGTAAILHGVPRATFDLDILVEATTGNASLLLHGLAAAGFGTATLITPDDLLAHEITIFKDRYRVDVQTRTPGLVFTEAWERRRMIEFSGLSIPVVSREDLIASKVASGRAVDLEDVRLLRAIKPD